MTALMTPCKEVTSNPVFVTGLARGLQRGASRTPGPGSVQGSVVRVRVPALQRKTPVLHRKAHKKSKYWELKCSC